ERESSRERHPLLPGRGGTLGAGLRGANGPFRGKRGPCFLVPGRRTILRRRTRSVARALLNLAMLVKESNRLDEAEPLSQRALAIDEASFGPEHPDVARDLHTLVQVLKAANRTAEAEPLSRRAACILLEFTHRTAYRHPHLHKMLEDYEGILNTLG